MSSPCSPVVLFLWGSLVGKEAGHSVNLCQRALSDVFVCLLSQTFRFCLTFFYCLRVVILQVFIAAASLSPVVLLPSSSCLLVLSSFSSCSPLGVLPLCCLVVLLALSGHSLSFFCPLGVFVLFSFPHPFVLCCPPHVLWSFCCPTTVVLFTMLSKAGARAAATHSNSNSCRLNCLGSMLVVVLLSSYIYIHTYMYTHSS